VIVAFPIETAVEDVSLPAKSTLAERVRTAAKIVIVVFIFALVDVDEAKIQRIAEVVQDESAGSGGNPMNSGW
jgi:hypothetical protein